jgi:hypothetical protein
MPLMPAPESDHAAFTKPKHSVIMFRLLHSTILLDPIP